MHVGAMARARACVYICMRERAVVVHARNIGVHCGGQAKPRTGSCVLLELRKKNATLTEMPQLGLLARKVG